MQQDTIQVIQKYQQVFMKGEQELKNLQLQTQLVVSEMTLFEVYSLSILERF